MLSLIKADFDDELSAYQHWVECRLISKQMLSEHGWDSPEFRQAVDSENAAFERLQAENRMAGMGDRA